MTHRLGGIRRGFRYDLKIVTYRLLHILVISIGRYPPRNGHTCTPGTHRTGNFNPHGQLGQHVTQLHGLTKITHMYQHPPTWSTCTDLPKLHTCTPQPPTGLTKIHHTHKLHTCTPHPPGDTYMCPKPFHEPSPNFPPKFTVNYS